MINDKLVIGYSLKSKDFGYKLKPKTKLFLLELKDGVEASVVILTCINLNNES